MRRSEIWSSSRPAFMVSKARDAALRKNLKDIRPATDNDNPSNFDRF